MKDAKSVVQNLEKSIAAAQKEQSAKAGELASLGLALTEATARLRAEERKQLEIDHAAKRRRLSEVLAALDLEWTPALEREAFELVCHFRMHKLCGQSHFAWVTFVNRLKTAKGATLRWSDLNQWVKSTEEAA